MASIREAIDAIRIDGLRGFSWFGLYTPVKPAGPRNSVSPAVLRRYLVGMIQNRLYEDFFQPGAARPSAHRATRHSSGPSARSFAQALSAANSGTGWWDDGWHVWKLGSDAVEVEKDGLLLIVSRESCLTQAGSNQASVHMPKELLRASPGYYLAFGNLALEAGIQNDPVVRIYLDLGPEQAVGAVRQLTTGLNASGTPFRLKALTDPLEYDRCDSVVLYVRRSSIQSTKPLLEAFLSDTLPAPEVPAFTRKLAGGIAIAEDPPDGQSFGLHRCRLLAEGLVEAQEMGPSDPESIMTVITQHFAASGIDLATPYLNSGSSDVYTPLSLKQAGPRTSPERAVAGAGGFLESADQIARGLCEAAVRHSGLCTWLGISPAPGVGARLGTLGPDLYDGTSGVALFLAEAALATSDSRTRQTALSAVRHSLSHLEDVHAAVRPAFYSGWLGIAFAAARIGSLLREPELIERSAEATDQALRAAEEATLENDLLAGRAGMICGLLTLAEMLSAPILEERAKELGHQLIEQAVMAEHGWSWASPEHHGKINLTGMSHGAAGIALSLLELFHRSGESEYRQAAERAFDYERYWFSEKRQNWPDFRDVNRHSRPGEALPYASAWCHGAPGIALSRARAWVLLNDDGLQQEARQGLEATTRAVSAALGRTPVAFDSCLCHGLSGLGETLMYGSKCFGDARLSRTARSIGIALCASSGGPTESRHSPGLMTGTAGVGYFLLRLAGGQAPSVLLIANEDSRC